MLIIIPTLTASRIPYPFIERYTVGLWGNVWRGTGDPSWLLERRAVYFFTSIAGIGSSVLIFYQFW